MSNLASFNIGNLLFNYFMVEEKNKNLITRPPVVVILGHVDHGKSSILEAIKDLKITEKESGGITQHIGAYEVEHQGKKITFIDTPGHEAFSAIRSRGAKVADIAILVVAAEEGIKPQTKEAIFHIKKAGIPVIVALNKIDKPVADPERVKRELSKEGILVESLGGKIPSVNTSAVTKKGISELLELILLIGEIEEFKGDISKPGEGVVIESYLDPKRGACATLLLRDGILKKGDIVATSSTLGKIKTLEDFQGKAIKKVLPSMPVIVTGFQNPPQVGEKLRVYSDIESAQKYLQKKERKKEKREVFLIEPDKKVLNLILKADVLGSLEAIEQVIKGLPQEKISLRILKKKIGEVSENDIKLAKIAHAKILAFRTKTNPIALKLADNQKVWIMNFEIIYDLAQGVRQIMEKALKPEKVRIDLGKFKTSVLFLTKKNRQIVGGKVIDGEIKRGALLEIFRQEQLVGKGKIVGLQKEKKDIEKAIKREEVGILYEGDTRIEEGDILLIYQIDKKKSEL